MTQSIVKVQMPVAGNMTVALVCNRDDSFCRHFPVHKFEAKMKGELKKFFRAHYNSHSFNLGMELPDQGW